MKYPGLFWRGLFIALLDFGLAAVNISLARESSFGWLLYIVGFACVAVGALILIDSIGIQVTKRIYWFEEMIGRR